MIGRVIFHSLIDWWSRRLIDWLIGWCDSCKYSIFFPFQALLGSSWYPVLWLWPFHTQWERWLTLSGRLEQKQKLLYEISPQFWWSYFSSAHPRISVAFIFFKQPVSVLSCWLIQFYVIFSLANYFMGFFRQRRGWLPISETSSTPRWWSRTWLTTTIKRPASSSIDCRTMSGQLEMLWRRIFQTGCDRCCPA